MGKPIRMLTVTAQKLIPASAATAQTTLFQKEEKSRLGRERLESTVDALRRRYGDQSILYASLIGNDLGFRDKPRPTED
jgi:DNA polymerase-4